MIDVESNYKKIDPIKLNPIKNHLPPIKSKKFSIDNIFSEFKDKDQVLSDKIFQNKVKFFYIRNYIE